MINKSLSTVVDIPLETIRRIVCEAGIRDDILSIGEPVAWVVQSYKIMLANHRTLLLQFCHQNFSDQAFVESRVSAIEMLRQIGIPQPAVLSYASDDAEYGLRYMLSEDHAGTQLFHRHPNTDSMQRVKMYRAVAEAYGKIHGVKNDWAGIWDGKPDKRKYSIHPSQFYYGAEIQNGSNRQLFDHKMITSGTYERICAAWESNLDFLVDREVSLAHVNSFPWNIRIANDDENYAVLGVSGIEFMWWDPMYDVANLLYPPFMDITQDERNAFLGSYGHPLNERAIGLYRLLNRILALANCFMAPVADEQGDRWVSEHIHELDLILAEIS